MHHHVHMVYACMHVYMLFSFMNICMHYIIYNLVMHRYQFSPTDPIPILFRQKMAETWLIPILGTYHFLQEIYSMLHKLYIYIKLSLNY